MLPPNFVKKIYNFNCKRMSKKINGIFYDLCVMIIRLIVRVGKVDL